jgi:hypothetical protein
MINDNGEETRKFPSGGYDVKVVRKKDVLDCIDANIIDKDIALEIITQCEIDACQYINQGKWTSIPYMGNIKVNDGAAVLIQNKELVDEARDALDNEKYILFRKRLVNEGKAKLKHSRYFNYIVSIQANRNRKLYNALVETNGETFAKVIMFSLANMDIVGDNINNVTYDSYGERQINNRQASYYR